MQTQKQKDISEVLTRLRKEYPEPRTALNFRTSFELLVATILSAQTTDAHVNRVTQSLFKKYKSVKDYVNVSLETLQRDVHSINFYKTKARNIQRSAQVIIERYNSSVPKTMDELLALPGVARKTANIILSNAFGIIEGIAVDTHVRRVAFRLGLTKNEDTQKIENDLMAITPKDEWADLSHLLIFHGRKICVAKKPRHNECVLFDICPSRDI